MADLWIHERVREAAVDGRISMSAAFMWSVIDEFVCKQIRPTNEMIAEASNRSVTAVRNNVGQLRAAGLVVRKYGPGRSRWDTRPWQDTPIRERPKLSRR